MKSAELDINIGPEIEIATYSEKQYQRNPFSTATSLRDSDPFKSIAFSISLSVTNRAKMTGTIDHISLIFSKETDKDKNYFTNDYQFFEIKSGNYWSVKGIETFSKTLQILGNHSMQHALSFYWDNMKNEILFTEGNYLLTILIWANGQNKPITPIIKKITIDKKSSDRLNNGFNTETGTSELYFFNTEHETTNKVYRSDEIKSLYGISSN